MIEVLYTKVIPLTFLFICTSVFIIAYNGGFRLWVLSLLKSFRLWIVGSLGRISPAFRRWYIQRHAQDRFWIGGRILE